MAVGLPPSRAEGSQSQLETPLLCRGVSTPQRTGKAVIGGSTWLLPGPVPLSVNLENLNCFSITEEEKGGGREKGRGKKPQKGKAKKRRAGCEVPAVQLARAQHLHSPD